MNRLTVKKASRARKKYPKPPDSSPTFLAARIHANPLAPLVKGSQHKGEVRIEECPYCGRPHFHSGYGHKSPQCGYRGRTTNEERRIGYTVIPPAYVREIRIHGRFTYYAVGKLELALVRLRYKLGLPLLKLYVPPYTTVDWM